MIERIAWWLIRRDLRGAFSGLHKKTMRLSDFDLLLMAYYVKPICRQLEEPCRT